MIGYLKLGSTRKICWFGNELGVRVFGFSGSRRMKIEELNFEESNYWEKSNFVLSESKIDPGCFRIMLDDGKQYRDATLEDFTKGIRIGD